MLNILIDFIGSTGFAVLTYKEIIMILISCVFLYLAIKRGYEPYLLIPIATGMLLVNLPLAGLMDKGGLIYYLYKGTELGIYPPLIFLCVGAGTDFGPLIANPKSILLGAAAQLGIFFAFLGAIALGFTGPEAASIGIIGGADGPTAIYLTSQLAPNLLGPIALAAYSYMALVPIIQPPIIRLLTTKEERMIKMEQARVVSKNEKIVFPIVVIVLVSLLLPSAASLVGMLMFGNLIKESGVVPKLAETATNTMMYMITIILGLTVGAKANAEAFLNPQTLKIIVLGLAAFSVGTAGGVIFGEDNVQTIRRKNKSNDRGSRSISSTNGSKSSTKSRTRRKSSKFLINACNGTKCCRSNRVSSSSWNIIKCVLAELKWALN